MAISQDKELQLWKRRTEKERKNIMEPIQNGFHVKARYPLSAFVFFFVGVQGEIVVHILPPAPDHAFRARHSGIVDSDANIRQ